MKYRIRIDLSFPDESDAQALLTHAKGLIDRAVSINEGEPNEQISYYDSEVCRHDEGLPCTQLERFEVRRP